MNNFLSHLVAFQRFIANSESKRYASVVDQDRSSILYFILTETEENVQALVDLLDGMERHRRSMRGVAAGAADGAARARPRPSLARTSLTAVAKDKSRARLADSKNDPRIALTERFNELEDTVLHIEKDRRASVRLDADTILEKDR